MRALALREVHTYYGLSHVLHGITLGVDVGEVVCLLGRNGAGKTTTIRSIMGLTPPHGGEIFVLGEAVQERHPHEIFQLGVRWIPQGRRVFPMLTVEENLRLALVTLHLKNDAEEMERAFHMFPVLREKRRHRASTLSGGQLQMLAIARALMGPTRLILMDEPTEGLAPILIDQIGEVILSIRGQGATVFLAEQNLPLALAVAERHYIIDRGRIRFEGTGPELQENEEVKHLYLGVAQRRDGRIDPDVRPDTP